MLLFAHVDSQRLIEQPGVNNPITEITIPRSAEAQISVMFVRSVSGGSEVFDPETTVAKILSTSITTGSDPCIVITSGAHGFDDGDTVKIRSVNDEVPTITGNYVITYIDTDVFSIVVPAPQTVAGTGGTATRIDPALNLRWTVKADGRFDQNPAMAAIVAGGFIKYGSGTTTVYKGQCNYFTDLINDALGVDAIPGNDNVQVDMMAELSWEGSNPGKVNWVKHSIRNDLFKVGDGAPPPSITSGASGKNSLDSLATQAVVLFPTPLSSEYWHFMGAPVIVNTVDPTPVAITVTGLVARSADGFTVNLSAATDTDDYWLEWVVAMD